MKKPLIAILTLSLGLTSCAATSTAQDAATPTSTSPAPSGEQPAGHGEIAGAQQVAEAPLHLLSIDQQGNAGLLDLLTEETTELMELGEVKSTSSDGRYVFAETAQGLQILDSGLWSWDHEDHFHYYKAEPQLIGTMTDAGPVKVSYPALSTAGHTGVYFPTDGAAVLLDNEALARGEISETFRLEVGAKQGSIVPLGDGALVSAQGESGKPGTLSYYNADGTSLPGTETTCSNPGAGTTTAAGTVIGCTEGALLATWDGENPELALIDYPDQAQLGDEPVQFNQRKGRPAVAMTDTKDGAWVLNVRTREWDQVFEGTAVEQVSAVGDTDGHVVAVDNSGQVLVQSTKDPQVNYSTAELEGGSGGQLMIDAERAYLSAVKPGVVYEIDFADEARISRTLTPATAPEHVQEVGR